MKKKKLILTFIFIVFILTVGIGGYFFFTTQVKNKDSLRFKNEYESLNNTVRESDGFLYNSVSIDEHNPIKYVSVDEAISLLKSQKAILYVGANWCPWCRNMLSPMFDVAKKLNISTIYYLELDDDKSNFEIQNNEVKKINNGSDSYYKLLDQLKDYLRDYELTDEKGKKYSTGEKRIYMPFFVTVRNGSIVEAKEISRTLEKDQNKYSDMTENQYNTLYQEFLNTFQKVYPSSGTCSLDGECS